MQDSFKHLGINVIITISYIKILFSYARTKTATQKLLEQAFDIMYSHFVKARCFIKNCS